MRRLITQGHEDAAHHDLGLRAREGAQSLPQKKTLSEKISQEVSSEVMENSELIICSEDC